MDATYGVVELLKCKPSFQVRWLGCFKPISKNNTQSLLLLAD